jgi:anaerobic selenocysteine-containing dehydrogenase
MSDETPKPTPHAMPEQLTRRAALRGIGLVGASAIVGGAAGEVANLRTTRPDATGLALRKPYVPGAERFSTHEQRWITTSCDCPSACGLRVRVVEGRAVRIEGNPEHPVSRGGASAVALAELEGLYDPRRVAGPLVREGARLVPSAWERSIAQLADRLAELRRRGAPEELVVISGRHRGASRDLLERFCRAFGTPNFVALGDSSPLAQAMASATGIAEDPVFDWQAAHYVLMLDAGVFDDSCRSTFVTRAVAEIRREREGSHASLAAAGPTFDLSAYNADEWIRTKPGSSCALCLGICHVLVRDALYDAGFVRERTTGFSDFARWILEAFPPERAASVAGVEPRAIVRLAHALAARRPSFVFADEKTCSCSNGRETALAVLSANALLGALGSVVGLAPEPPLARWPEIAADDVARAALGRPRVDGAGARYPHARSAPAALPEALLAKRASVVVFDAVPPSALPSSRWRHALEAVPFVVSLSPFLDEPAASAAHLVLPDHTLLESWGDTVASTVLGAAVVGVRRPAVQPLHDTRAAGDVFLDVARRLGDPIATAMPWHSLREALELRLRGLSDSKRGSIARGGVASLFDAGFWADPDPPRRTVERFAFAIADAVPAWRGDPQAFPLALLAHASLADPTRGSWLRVVRSRPHAPTTAGYASIHPESAGGVHDGEPITLETPFGAVATIARLDPRMAPGCIAIVATAEIVDILSPEPAPLTGVMPLAATRARIVGRRS